MEHVSISISKDMIDEQRTKETGIETDTATTFF
jgi:hypothetical protein